MKPKAVFKIKRIIDLLKFVLTLDDKEVMKATIESTIELLEELKDDTNN